jgi:hypothetical protein
MTQRFSNPLALARKLLFVAALPLSITLAQDTLPKLDIAGPFGVKSFTGVRVMSTTAAGVKISHDSGIATIPFKDLPPELASKYKPEAAVSSATPTPPPASGVPGHAPSGPFKPDSLVIIKTDSSSGSGFIVTDGSKTYVYTNAHVLCGSPGGFTKKIEKIVTASGEVIPTPFEVELSESFDPNSPSGLEDLARFSVTVKDGTPAYDIRSVSASNLMNQAVIAFGNSDGQDVITSLKGEVLGVGTDRVEISCPIVGGNSGGPVVSVDTGAVIGVSTYLVAGRRDIWAKDTDFEKVRRFAVRPDKVTKWRRVQYTNLMTSLASMEAFDRDTLSLAAASFLNPKWNRGGFDVPTNQKGDYIIREIIVEGSKHRLGGAIASGITTVNQRFAGVSGNISMSAVVPVFQNFFAEVLHASSAQVTDVGGTDRAPYLKQFIKEMVEVRREVEAVFRERSTDFR